MPELPVSHHSIECLRAEVKLTNQGRQSQEDNIRNEN